MSILNTSSYQFARPTGHCVFTGMAIPPLAGYIACLVEGEEDESLERRDVSLEMWERGERPERLFAFWRATMPSPEQKHDPFLGDDELLAIFEQLCENPEESSEQQSVFRFLLALLLLRKRLLRQDGSRAGAGGRRVMLLRRKGENKDETPAIAVPDPGLDETHAADAAIALGRALRGDE
ncbi:MAG: hypothetical protein H6814_08405 [Phycisphaeraceae bacterium]|nr:hypothetical protein [Phycisphaeraceae bacterium]